MRVQKIIRKEKVLVKIKGFLLYAVVWHFTARAYLL